MSLLFNRNVIVQVGDDEGAIKIPTTFKISFDIQKMINANSCQGNVTIYNLADNSKELIRDKGQRIRIFAGYGTDTPPLLHDGDILRTAQVDNQSDRETIIYFGSRVYTTANAVFSKSYQSSVTVRQIVSDAIKTFDLNYSEDTLNLIPSGSTLSTYSFHGRTVDALNNLLTPLNLQFFEQNSEILLSKIGRAISSSENDIYILNSNTGLIKTAVQTDRGVNATCLLNSKLTVGNIVKIESDVLQNASFNTYNVQKQSKNTEGYYKIIQANYQGDNWDGKFEAILQCVPYGTSSTNGGN